MPAAISHRQLLLLATGLFALAGAAHLLVAQAAIGASHVFYVAIALAALAGGAPGGAAAGLFATGLYCAGLATNPHFTDANPLTFETLLRAVTYVSTGVLVGWLGGHNRRVVSGLRELAEVDHLTGLGNRRAFERELARRCEGERRFAVLIGDVDRLKLVNDRDGHAEGDRLLRRVASILREALRDEDLIARVGGDEFGLLVAAADDVDGAALAARLERQLARRGVSVSFGWALHPAGGETPSELFERADERLYESKADQRPGVAGRLAAGAG